MNTGAYAYQLATSFTKTADASAYSSGDAIANSTTASAVVPLTFDFSGGYTKGAVWGARAVVTPASGNLVITGLDFDLLLFRPKSGIPFAAGSYAADNAALNVSAAAMRELIGVFSFVNTAWRSPAGSTSAGTSGWQAVAPTGRSKYLFDTSSLTSVGGTLLGLLQAKGTWTPTAVVQVIDIALDVELV